MTREGRKILEFDVGKVKDGTCVIVKGEGGTRFAVCREGSKIKIYLVVEEDLSPMTNMTNLVVIGQEVLSKYEVRNDGKLQEIREALARARTIEAKRGHLYEIDDGVFVGVDRKGRLRIYLA